MEYILDIETDGLLDTVTKVHCVVLRELGNDKVHTFHTYRCKDAIELLNNADALIGHNLIGYDLPALEKLWGWKYEGDVVDTLVCSRTIWPHLGTIDSTKNFPTKLIGSHSLKAWGVRLGEFKGDYNDGSPNVWAEFNEEMLEYCVQDTKVTEKLYVEIQKLGFSEDALALEHSIATEMFRQQERGFCFDAKAAQKLFAELAQRKYEIETELVETFEPTIIEMKTKTKILPFNPASRQQIADRLIKRGWVPEIFTPSGVPKVDEDTLGNVDMPEAKLLQEFFLLNKRLGQIATGKQAWLKLEKNGKIHGRVNHMGAVTSRCTHSNPNMAQVPSVGAPYGAECRAMFTVPKGYKLLGADASGLELRCLAHYMHPFDDGKYGDVILNGDIHSVNQEAAGLPTRANAKTFIYGFLYGAGDEKVGEIIGGGGKEGKAIKKKFLKQTPALKQLRTTVSRAAERGWLKGLDGRKIPVRHAHAALNTLLQSAGAIICKRWYMMIEEQLRAKGYTEVEVAIVAFVHDEVQIQVKEGLEDEIGKLVVNAIKDVERYYSFKCPLDAEYSVGHNWQETH